MPGQRPALHTVMVPPTPVKRIGVSRVWRSLSKEASLNRWELVQESMQTVFGREMSWRGEVVSARLYLQNA